jgi:hypothetical protein
MTVLTFDDVKYARLRLRLRLRRGVAVLICVRS